MSSAIESAIEPLLHSPLLCEIAETLQSRVRDEAERRRKFYRELRDDQKAEFVDGQVILHSPARDKHIAVRQNLERVLGTYTARGSQCPPKFGGACCCIGSPVRWHGSSTA